MRSSTAMSLCPVKARSARKAARLFRILLTRLAPARLRCSLGHSGSAVVLSVSKVLMIISSVCDVRCQHVARSLSESRALERTIRMHTSALNDAARSLFEDAICQYGGNGLQAGTEEQRRKSSGTARPKANQMR